MALMILQYVPDADDPWGIVGRLLEPLAAGSYLTVSDTVRDIPHTAAYRGHGAPERAHGPDAPDPAFTARV